MLLQFKKSTHQLLRNVFQHEDDVIFFASEMIFALSQPSDSVRCRLQAWLQQFCRLVNADND